MVKPAILSCTGDEDRNFIRLSIAAGHYFNEFFREFLG
jgi:hypothetical protein